jgi:predicted dehydrogenase
MLGKEQKMPRRDFVKNTAVLTAAAAVPTYLAASGCTEKKEFPKGKLNIAAIGLGMGFHNLKRCADENIVAMCDVDERILEGKLKEFTKEFPDKVVPYTYQDYRKMFKQIGDQIDAVIVATPDHTHAKIALDAMKLGKHVYCQKPLTHSVYESRILTQAARKYKVATQMGNQGASGGSTEWACEAIWSGAIGDVKEVHAWTNRPIWPQCMNRPDDEPNVPSKLDWDLWLGPAKNRPYHPAYHPWNWRGWWDFGTGALGDMACHILDVAMRSLKLGYPEGIQASTSKWTFESPAEAQKVTYYFPAREAYRSVNMPEVKLTWYDGGLMPDRPVELEDGEMMGDDSGGVMFVGTKGKLITGCYARGPKLIPRDKFDGYRPDIKARRVEGGMDSHEKDWIRACKEKTAERVEPKSNFAFAGPFNEVVVMGTVATRLAALNRILKWDGKNMKFTNIKDDEVIKIPKVIKLEERNNIPYYNKEYVNVNALEYAQSLIKRKERKGWELEL